MAFNWQTFRTRALTAIIFAAVMLTGLLWNRWSFLVLFSVIHFGCWWEYFKLIEKIRQIVLHVYVKLGLMLLGYGLMSWFCGATYHINNYAIKDNFSLPVTLAGFILLLTGIFQKNKIDLRSFGYAALGLLYISLSWGLMIELYQSVYISLHATALLTVEYILPVIVIASIWINDTMAYIVGSFIGKTPLSKISPKKTWEGTIGGIILSMVVVAFVLPLLIFPTGIGFTFSLMLAVISLVAAVAGTFGDLLESKLKRLAGVKDSGRIMPGHGGFLDRFDSLLVAVPCVWILLKIAGLILEMM